MSCDKLTMQHILNIYDIMLDDVSVVDGLYSCAVSDMLEYVEELSMRVEACRVSLGGIDCPNPPGGEGGIKSFGECG